MSGAAFIDLGEEWSVVEERPVRSRRRPGHRAPLAALLLVVVLLLAGGSAATASPFTPLATIAFPDISAITLGGGGLFVAGGTATAPTVARYQPETGALTWTTAVPQRADVMGYLDAAGVLTVWSYGQDTPNQVAVLDGATGALLWSLSGDVFGLPGPNARTALTVAADPNSPSQARYIDLRTGQAIWSRPVPALAQVVTTDVRAPADAAGFVVVAAPDGTVTLLARDTGAVVGGLKIDPLVPIGADPNSPDIAVLTLIGGRLLVARRMGAPDAEVASYDLPALTLRWRRGGSLPGYPWPCGANLCLSGVAGDMTAVDPDTGATRWTAKGWQTAGDLAGGRMLALANGSTAHAGILDSATGRLLGDLGTWTILADPVYRLATRPAYGTASTWIGVLDPDRATVRPLGMLDRVRTGGCVSRGDVLACQTLDHSVRVWRYRPGP